MIVTLAISACTAAPAPPEPDAPPPDAHRYSESLVGHLKVETWVTGGEHAVGEEAEKSWLRLTFDGVPIRVGDHDLANRLDLPPTDDPKVGVLGYDDAGWYLVDFATGRQTLLWSDWADEGVWSLDGSWYVGHAGAWNVASHKLTPIGVAAGAEFVSFSPDGKQTAEFATGKSWVDGKIVSQRWIRVRDPSGRLVQEVDVSAGTPGWVDETGMEGLPWRFTRNPRALWIARHLDWRPVGTDWEVQVAAETRAWPSASP